MSTLSVYDDSYYTRRILDALQEDLPEEGIFKLYQESGKREWVAVALISVLMLRHRQWQAALGKNESQ